MWKVTLGALQTVTGLNLGPFQHGNHHTRSLLNLCLKQVGDLSKWNTQSLTGLPGTCKWHMYAGRLGCQITRDQKKKLHRCSC